MDLRQIHTRFTGARGTFAHFGDSITETMAFWTPLPIARKNASPELERAFQRVNAYLLPACWRDWKGPAYGNQGGQTAEWACRYIDAWLKALNPEVALIQFGTNDLRSIEVGLYRDQLRTLAQKCLDNGTIALLSTIPPRHNFEAKAAAFAQAARDVARGLDLPLIDFHAEVLRRRPTDWDGAREEFAAFRDYEVPTLLSRDGVHPSAPSRFENDYSDEALRCNGYGLRTYLTLLKYAEVVETLTAPPERPWFPRAPALPPATRDVVRAATVEALFAAVERVPRGGTILVADGHYPLPRRLEIKRDGVTLRGESGRREKVVLDGGGALGELLAVTACADVTIADLTVQNVRWNGIKIDSETGVQRLTIRNCILHNIWQRAVKGVKVPAEGRERLRPKGCRVQWCLFYNDRPKRFDDDPADTPQNFEGNYIGGIDLMYPRGWTIADNVFVGIHGRTGSARGAIFLWHEAEECVIERNVIIDCDSGICLGNSSKPDDVPVHAIRLIVRNNLLTRVPENGILADFTRDCKIVHNTVHDPKSRLGRLIRLVHDNDGLLVANNLISGPPLRNESTSRVTLRSNLERDLTDALVAPQEGNLRLLRAIDRAEALPDVTEDIDRKPRGRTATIGASERA